MLHMSRNTVRPSVADRRFDYIDQFVRRVFIDDERTRAFSAQTIAYLLVDVAGTLLLLIRSSESARYLDPITWESSLYAAFAHGLCPQLSGLTTSPLFKISDE